MTQEVRAKQEAETAQLGARRRQRRHRRARPTAATAATATRSRSRRPAALTETPPVRPAKMSGGDLGPACEQCGGMMQRTGILLHVLQLRQQHRLRLRSHPGAGREPRWRRPKVGGSGALPITVRQ